MTATRFAYIVFWVLAFHCVAQAKRVYEQGTVIDLSPKYIDSPAPSSVFLNLPPPRILVGYELQIRVGDQTYFLNVASCCLFRQTRLEWAVGDTVQFRTGKHNKMFVRRLKGKELNARLVKVVSGIASPSLSTSSVASGPQFPLPPNETRRHKKLPLTLDFLRADEMCLVLFGNVGAEDFFDHIRTRKTRNGTEFRSSGQVVATFPETLVVSVIAVLGKCSATEIKAQGDDMTRKSLRFDENFMESITFDGSWKEGLSVKPAEIGPLVEGRIPNPNPAWNDRDWWEYQFKVKSEGVSLQNALVIELQSPNGKMIARFSARLSNRM